MKIEPLTKTEVEQIELKFECLRRNNKYAKDYEKMKEWEGSSSYKKDPYFLDRIFTSKWFHFPLLDPKVSIKTYKRKYGKKYLWWLKRNLGSLITSDPASSKSLSVISPELRKYFLLKKRGYSQVYSIKKGKFIKTLLHAYDEIYSKLNIKKIKEELKAVKLELDLKNMTEDEIRKQVGQLFKELKPLRDKFLYGDKIVSIRPNYVKKYLETYDRKLNKSHKEMSENENQVRKFKKQIKIVKLLIKGGWRDI